MAAKIALFAFMFALGMLLGKLSHIGSFI